MKKTPSRKLEQQLSLHRETLCQLSSQDLRVAAGRIPLPHTYTTCGTLLCHSASC
ncbi:MAG TPA: hypothetical protein VF173_16525 [Thermoanaerobaculia bacterium]|nr:hypothetical protein [Thermoanaerobaculia bacterium]